MVIKKALNLKITLCILLGLYVIILTALLIVFKGEIKNFWFSLLLAFLGLYLLKKTMLMNSDSSLWLSMLFIAFSFGFLLFLYIPLFQGQLLLILSVCVAFASIIVFLTWKNEVHLYLFITTFISIVPSVFYTFKLINFWWLTILVVGVNVLNYFVYKLFIYLFANKK